MPILSPMSTSLDFSLTPSAAARIATLLKDEPSPDTRFRVAVLGGGCSGFQYNFDFDAGELAEDDLTFEQDGAKIVIDQSSMSLLAGSQLDYTEELVGAAFSIKNPQAKSGCGCGNSFSL